jgi:glycosyltransferase involved in cell wall biosynthesis
VCRPSRAERHRDGRQRMSGDQSAVLVVPLAPSDGGNGLAMRAGMLLDAMAARGPVDLVVVPVAGAADDLAWARERARTVLVEAPMTADAARGHMIAQLADPELRDRLEASAPLPGRVALAPPTLAAESAAALRWAATTTGSLLALRLYLAPFGIELARRLGVNRVVVDVDVDDEALHRMGGDVAGADACGRLARAWLPVADGVIAAAREDADALAARYELGSVAVVPNAVAPAVDLMPRPGTGRLLFVGNLTYPPNLAAVRLLAHEILPRVRSRRPAVTVDIVGPDGPGALDDVAQIDGVRIAGLVPDVAPWYATADVVVAPLVQGSGTRIKLLEAFAYRRPVVASPVALAGLAVHDGVEVLVADRVNHFADAVVRVLRDGRCAEAMVEQAAQTLARHYTPAVVAPLVRSAVFGTPDGRPGRDAGAPEAA